MTITPRSPTELSAGTYSDTINIYACFDTQCTRQVSGSPKTVTVTHTVKPETKIQSSSPSLQFTAVEGQSTNAQVITLSSTKGVMPAWTHQITYISGSDWLTVSEDTQNNTLTLNANPTVAGNYSALLGIDYTADGRLKHTDITVNYVVTSILTTPQDPILFTSVEGETPAQQTIKIAFSTTTAPTWSYTTTYTDGSGWLNVTQAGDALTLQPNLLSVGTYKATVQIQYMLGSIGTSTMDIPVTYTVSQGVTISQTSVTANASEGLSPAAIPISINYTGTGNISWSTSIAYQTGNNWLALSQTSGNSLPAGFNLSFSPLIQGTYTALLTVNYSYGGISSKFDIPVTYTTGSAWSVPSSVNFTLDGSSALTDLNQTITIADTYNAASSLNWTAVISDPWVTADVLSGNTSSGSQITLSLVSSEIQKLPGGSHSTTLVLTSDNPNVASISIPINLTISMPVISYITPYVDYESTVGNDYKVLRGNHLLGLTQNVMFGSTPAVDITVVSDTEIHVTPPALTAGTYKVYVDNPLGLQLSNADLVVKKAPTFTNTSITTNIGLVERVIYDEEREVVFGAQCSFCTVTGNGTPATIYRFSYNNGWVMASYSYPGLYDIALTPDGRQLLVLTANQLLFVDPSTMTTSKVVNLPFTVSGVSDQMAVMDNGKILFISQQKTYSLIDGTFGSFSLLGSKVGIAVSADGSHAATGDASNSNIHPIQYYDASTDTWTDTGEAYYYLRGKFDRHGQRLFASDNLYDESTFTLLGPLPAGVNSSGGEITQDGNTIYSLDYLTSNTAQVNVVDVSGLPPYVLSTPIPIPNTEYPGVSRMILNRTGNLLFIIGENKFLVLNVN